MEEIECNIDEDFDNEKFTGKMINNSFINKLKDFSSFNPSGNKGFKKINWISFENKHHDYFYKSNKNENRSYVW